MLANFFLFFLLASFMLETQMINKYIEFIIFVIYGIFTSCTTFNPFTCTGCMPPIPRGMRRRGRRGEKPPGSEFSFGLWPLPFCILRSTCKRAKWAPSHFTSFSFPLPPSVRQFRKDQSPTACFLGPFRGQIFFSDYKAIKANLMNGLVMMPSFLWMPSSSSWFHWSISHKISLWRWGFFSRPSCW